MFRLLWLRDGASPSPNPHQYVALAEPGRAHRDAGGLERLDFSPKTTCVLEPPAVAAILMVDVSLTQHWIQWNQSIGRRKLGRAKIGLKPEKAGTRAHSVFEGGINVSHVGCQLSDA